MADHVNKRKRRTSLRSGGENVASARATRLESRPLDGDAESNGAAPADPATPERAVTGREFESQAMARLLCRLTDPEMDLQGEIKIIEAYCRLKREKTAKLKVGKVGGKGARAGSGRSGLEQRKSPDVENDQPDAEKEARELETLSQAVRRIYGVEMPK